MKKVLLAAVLAALSLGCAVTDYPVIVDSRGADDDGVAQGQYDLAYIAIPSQIATIWDDGSDELFSLVSQDWKGDQWLKTFNNFDPTATILFRDQTYCDPNYDKSLCPLSVAWNPDTADDDPFDYTFDPSCSGARSLSMLAQYTSRYGECGSGWMADKQAALYEFSQLQTVEFMGKQVYHLPIDASVASFQFTGEDGIVGDMKVFGRFNAYIDQHFRTAFPMTPNARYQLRALDQWIKAHGHRIDVDLTYGSLSANLKISVTSLQAALDRL
ncbi:MAG: hypothetical protein KBD01_15640 [Acidobacteria bacterium]|nr:hypothetical protein [Acidobacteriota bacterium]